ncbi:MAG: hypothetical protein AB1642_11305 [Pseudomonadota bacterium]
MIRRLAALLLLACWPALALPGEGAAPRASASQASAPDSARLAKDLQSLDWKQFKSVIEAIPKLKADIDAFGPLGWKFVEKNYPTHDWKRNIDRFDAAEKRQLAELIGAARRVR